MRCCVSALLLCVRVFCSRCPAPSACDALRHQCHTLRTDTCTCLPLSCRLFGLPWTHAPLYSLVREAAAAAAPASHRV